MSALQKLQEKIEQWRRDHEALKEENQNLKNQLSQAQESQKEGESLKTELDASKERCVSLEAQITALRRELEEKDAEIEKIITQVEALLA